MPPSSLLRGPRPRRPPTLGARRRRRRRPRRRQQPAAAAPSLPLPCSALISREEARKVPARCSPAPSKQAPRERRCFVPKAPARCRGAPREGAPPLSRRSPSPGRLLHNLHWAQAARRRRPKGLRGTRPLEDARRIPEIVPGDSPEIVPGDSPEISGLSRGGGEAAAPSRMRASVAFGAGGEAARA